MGSKLSSTKGPWSIPSNVKRSAKNKWATFFFVCIFCNQCGNKDVRLVIASRGGKGNPCVTCNFFATFDLAFVTHAAEQVSTALPLPWDPLKGISVILSSRILLSRGFELSRSAMDCIPINVCPTSRFAKEQGRDPAPKRRHVPTLVPGPIP